MDSAPDLSGFIFIQVQSSLAVEAYLFHKSQSSNEHIWPRTETQIHEYAENGELFAVRSASTGEFVGLCYATLDGEEWEIGGLTVPERMRHLHLGTFLTRFALAYTIAMQRPWHYRQKIIAHVHQDNPKPRRLLEQVIGFVFAEKVEIPGELAPAPMKRNEAGNLCGDKFIFPPSAVKGLLTWFEQEFKGTLDDGRTPACFVVPGGLQALVDSLREAAQ